MQRLTWAAHIPFGLLLVLGAFVGGFATLGADALWAASLGREILTTGAIPEGVPTATLDSGDWDNVPVLGEVVLAVFAALGPMGLVCLQLACVLGATTLLIWGASIQGAGPVATTLVLLLVALATLAAFVVIRMPVLSLVPWVILIALLRGVAGDGLTRKSIWTALSVLAVWGNLHGGVLVGICLLGVFVLFGPAIRARPFCAMLLGVGGLAVVLLLTPQGTDTWRYYVGVLTNEAIRSGSQLWAAPSLGNPLDALMVLSLLGLLLAFVRSRPPLWEVVAVLGMIVATLVSARHGVFLALFLAPRAASGLSRPAHPPGGPPSIWWPTGAAVLGMVIGLLVAAPRSASIDYWSEVAHSVKAVAEGRAVLASEPLAESVAYAGGRSVMGNPLDAFRREDQRAYLDFLDASGVSETLVDPGTVIVAHHRSSIATLVAADARFAPLARIGDFTVWSTLASAR